MWNVAKLGSLFSPTTSRAAARRRGGKTRLGLEALEGRLLLCNGPCNGLTTTAEFARLGHVNHGHLLHPGVAHPSVAMEYPGVGRR
jgi:hypothetical protein